MFKILKDFKGSPDGYTVIDYVAGSKVDLAPSLAEVAVKEKWAKELPPEPKADPEAERRAAEEKATSAALAERMAAIDDCEKRLAAAPDADKPALEAELAALKA